MQEFQYNVDAIVITVRGARPGDLAAALTEHFRLQLQQLCNGLVIQSCIACPVCVSRSVAMRRWTFFGAHEQPTQPQPRKARADGPSGGTTPVRGHGHHASRRVASRAAPDRGLAMPAAVHIIVD